MFTLLLAADTPPELSYPWWVTNALVPAAISILGCLLTMLAGLWIASRTEWYRRLSRWEPYSEHLWTEQRRSSVALCQAASDAMYAAMELALYYGRKTEKEDHELVDTCNERMERMRTLAVEAGILLSSEFNQAYSKFESKHRMFKGIQRVDEQSLSESMQLQGEMAKLYGDLLDAARTGLGIDALDRAARDAILGSIKQGPEQTREGLSN